MRGEMEMNWNPKVFISYSWEDTEHKDWVKSFTDKLIENGIEATFDQYDLTLGDRLPEFMEQSITAADYVLIICTPAYKEKSDNRKGGVGYEGHIISAELLSQNNERKFIPIIRKGNISTALPNCLAGKLGLDFTSGYEENAFSDLITTLYGAKKKPALGARPSYVGSKEIEPPSRKDESIHILGIVTDEVTVPKMDGTRGCALYKIPFKLSKFPSSLWSKLFVETWNFPPRFTTMHRPGIASVVGDEIILNGTTIEEVRDIHRETLKLCVDIANAEEKKILEVEHQKRIKEENRKQQHYQNVESIANSIKF